MTLKNIKQQGFTIVELLIVIVVIAILAAITIVAYNGVQNRAKTTAGQSAATNAAKKAELYNTEKSSYPATSSLLTTGQSGQTWELTGVIFDTTALSTSNLPTATNELNIYKCGTNGTTTAPTTAAGVTSQTGTRFDYWNYQTTSTNSVSAGQTTGTVGTYPIGCGLSS